MTTKARKLSWLTALGALGLAASISLPTQAADRKDVIAGVVIGATAGYLLSEHGGGMQVVYHQDVDYRHSHDYYRPSYHRHDYHEPHYHGRKQCYHDSHLPKFKHHGFDNKPRWSHRDDDRRFSYERDHDRHREYASRSTFGVNSRAYDKRR